MAKFQNHVDRIDQNLQAHLNPRPQTEKNGTRMFSLPTIRQNFVPVSNKEANKPVKDILKDQKFSYLTADPENAKGHSMIRSKFGLVEPNQFKYGRS